MKQLRNLLSVKVGDILFFGGCYILVEINNQYVEGTAIYQTENINSDIKFGDKVFITRIDLSYEDWYKLNKSETQAIKLSLL